MHDQELPKLNHTQLSNDFIDKYMNKVAGNSVKIFIAIARKTIGWHKPSDKVSLSQLTEMTGVSRMTAVKSIAELESIGIIKVSKTTKNHKKQPNRYNINYGKMIETIPLNESVVNNLDHPSIKTILPSSIKTIHTKETKYTNTKEIKTVTKATEPKQSKYSEKTKATFALFANLYKEVTAMSYQASKPIFADWENCKKINSRCEKNGIDLKQVIVYHLKQSFKGYKRNIATLEKNLEQFAMEMKPEQGHASNISDNRGKIQKELEDEMAYYDNIHNLNKIRDAKLGVR